MRRLSFQPASDSLRMSSGPARVSASSVFKEARMSGNAWMSLSHKFSFRWRHGGFLLSRGAFRSSHHPALGAWVRHFLEEAHVGQFVHVFIAHAFFQFVTWWLSFQPANGSLRMPSGPARMSASSVFKEARMSGDVHGFIAQAFFQLATWRLSVQPASVTFLMSSSPARVSATFVFAAARMAGIHAVRLPL